MVPTCQSVNSQCETQVSCSPKQPSERHNDKKKKQNNNKKKKDVSNIFDSQYLCQVFGVFLPALSPSPLQLLSLPELEFSLVVEGELGREIGLP